MKRLSVVFLLFILTSQADAQELQAKITVLASKVTTKVDKKIFQTLQTGLANFLNNRKWGNATYQLNEKVKCSFLINIDQELGDNIYEASVTVQASRPVFNTAYESALVNVIDNDVTFRYVEFQPIEFNENRVQGNDPMVANITAVLAYYVNIILGLDADSFSPRGGDVFFQKAQNIVNNAPEANYISGWKTFDGVRNRYRLVENLMDVRFNLVHDAIYSYYRKGLDQFYENEDAARTGVVAALNFLTVVNKDNPNSMVIQFFFQGRSNELVKMFSRASPDIKVQARDMLVKLDIANTTVYKDLK
jgi:hypothetical protein